MTKRRFFVIIIRLSDLLQMTVGNAHYHCSCVRYVSQDSINLLLIVAVSAGAGLLLIIIIIIICLIIVIVLCRRRHSIQSGQRQPPRAKREVSTDHVYEETLNNTQLSENYYDVIRDQENPSSSQIPRRTYHDIRV